MILRNLNRTREIIAVLLKYGFEDLVVNTPLHRLIPRRMLIKWSPTDDPISKFTRWERLRMACEELGPTFVKLAQIASNRPDILPEPLIQEFKKLQSSVKPFPVEQLRQILDEELPKGIHGTFEYVDEEILGSASIGQVHKAKLISGETVVVKVRRPGVKKKMMQDLAIIRDIVSRLEDYLKQQGIINAIDAVDAFKKSMEKELDFLHEARNIENFRAFYKNNKDFYVPKAYKHYSTEKVTVLEFVSGCKISDVKQMRAWGIDPITIAENGMHIYLTQIFEFGYFHADPHPGNVLVDKTGKIILLDFGMIGKLTRKDKASFASIFVAMSREDPLMMAINLKKLAIEDEVDDIRKLEYDLTEIIDDFATLDVSEGSIEDLIDRLQRVMYDYKMRVPGAVFLIFRALAVLEGIGKTIHPYFKTYEFVKPYGLKVLKDVYAPKNLANDAMFRTNQVLELANAIPTELRTILKKLRQGRLRLEIEPRAYDALLRKMDRTVNRIILALIIVFLMVSSSIMATASHLPSSEKLGIPFISVIGFALALFFGFVLLFAVLRTRKL